MGPNDWRHISRRRKKAVEGVDVVAGAEFDQALCALAVQRSNIELYMHRVYIKGDGDERFPEIAEQKDDYKKPYERVGECVGYSFSNTFGILNWNPVPIGYCLGKGLDIDFKKVRARDYNEDLMRYDGCISAKGAEKLSMRRVFIIAAGGECFSEIAEKKYDYKKAQERLGKCLCHHLFIFGMLVTNNIFGILHWSPVPIVSCEGKELDSDFKKTRARGYKEDLMAVYIVLFSVVLVFFSGVPTTVAFVVGAATSILELCMHRVYIRGGGEELGSEIAEKKDEYKKSHERFEESVCHHPFNIFGILNWERGADRVLRG